MSAGATLRQQLHKQLRPLLPRRYDLKPNSAKLERITKPTVQLKQLAMLPAAEAPAGALVVEFVVTLACPLTAPQAAEDQLDDDVTELLAALDRVPFINWTRADKVAVDDRWLGYDVQLTVTTTPPPTTTPTT